MPEGPANKIAEGYIDISVRQEKLDQELEQAKNKVDKTTEDIGRSAKDNIGGGFEAVGEKIEDSTKGARKLTGAISSTVGVATSLLGAFTAIAGILAVCVKFATAMYERIKGSSELSATLAASLEQQAAALKKLRDETPVEASLKAEIEYLEGRQKKGEKYVFVQETLVKLETVLADRRKQLADITDRLNREVPREITEEIKRQNALIEQQLTLREKVLETEIRVGNRIRQTIREREEEEMESVRRRQRAAINAILEESRVRYEERRKQHEEELRRLRVEEEAISKLFNTIRTNQGQLGSLTGTIETLADRVEAAIYASGQTSSVRRS